ncbi:MAG TPA: glycosyltransferase family 4 protein [Gaiellaceae bacterium]|nr:glycosyltransferase family 4 protein [Gaiellaceae bacterium]
MTVDSADFLYVSHDLFSLGGIQRYGRYEVRALGNLAGRNAVRACSLAPPVTGGFAGALPIDVVGRGFGVRAKAAFALRVLRAARRGAAHGRTICDHIALAPLGLVCRLLLGRRYCLNVYGAEVWKPIPLLQRIALLRAETIVSDCDFTRRDLEGRFPKLRGRIAIVHDCVDCERFRPRDPLPGLADRLGLRAGVPTVLTVSRLPETRFKGHDRVIRALAELRGEGVESQYLIVGDGPDRPRLEALAAELGLKDAVLFAGNVEDDLLPDVYLLSDVFVLASGMKTETGARWFGEGVPLVVIEAQACGKPAIASSLDGAAESLAHGRTGFLVDPDDHVELTAALASLLRDDVLRKQFAAASRPYAIENFSFEVFQERIGRALGITESHAGPAAPS